jgi:DNA-binding NarL/FixJ family response regulator
MTGDPQRARSPTSRWDVGVVTVDDQPAFRGAARDVIEATAGFTSVGEADCGEEGVALVHERKPDLVLVDVRMPGMDGIETAKQIKETLPHVVVVLITIEDPATFSPQAVRAGADTLVRKQDFGVGMLRRLWVVYGSGH